MRRCLLPFVLGVGCVVAVAGPSAQEAPQPSFSEFIEGIRTEALAQGIKPATLDAALSNLEPASVVVARDRAQPEQVQSLDQYVSRRVTTRTIQTARTMLTRHRTTLAKVASAYGVPSQVLVSIWGLESNFGQFTGTYPTVQALATLAYDGRRALFREELLHALTIIDRGLAPADALKGSWAGAMGQPQFMPSSFLERAVDFDGNGAIDIWKTPADVFGSMGNYMKIAGWTTGERWGREVAVSKETLARIDEAVPMRTEGCRAVRELTQAVPLDTWRNLGVTLPGGAPLPQAVLTASLIRGGSRYFLAYQNYHAILDYNCSNSYALAVALLADAIRP